MPEKNLQARETWTREAADATDLDALAEAINTAVEMPMPSQLRTGVYLLEARRRVLENGGSWPRWCEKHVVFTMRHVKRCISLAVADDPHAAAAAERESTRTRMQGLRTRREGDARASPKIREIPKMRLPFPLEIVLYDGLAEHIITARKGATLEQVVEVFQEECAAYLRRAISREMMAA